MPTFEYKLLKNLVLIGIRLIIFDLGPYLVLVPFQSLFFLIIEF